MSQLAGLFRESETRIGVFYPKNYVVAIFRCFDHAESARKALRRAGFTEQEAIAVPGADVLEYIAEVRAETGIWGMLMTELSRLIGTEAVFGDEDIDKAKRGAGFLVVRCEAEEEADKIRQLVVDCEPMEMQWYRAGAIRSLV